MRKISRFFLCFYEIFRLLLFVDYLINCENVEKAEEIALSKICEEELQIEALNDVMNYFSDQKNSSEIE